MKHLLIVIGLLALSGCTSLERKTYFYPDTTKVETILETEIQYNRVVKTSTVFDTNDAGFKQLNSKMICYKYWWHDTYCDVVQ